MKFQLAKAWKNKRQTMGSRTKSGEHVAAEMASAPQAANPPADMVRSPIELAHEAELVSNFDEALLRWGEVVAETPDMPDGYIGRAGILRRLNRFDEADQAILDAQGRFSDNVTLAIAFALNAQHNRDWTEALKRWSDVCDRFPDHPYAYAASASVLLEFGRLDEAEMLLAEATRMFPDDVTVGVHFANIASARDDRVAAITRWSALLDRFPDDPFLRTEAPTVIAALRSAMTQFDVAALREKVIQAQANADWSSAIRVCELILRIDQVEHFGLLMLGIAQREHGLFDAADKTLRQAISLYPDNAENRANYAEVAAKRCDWPEAATRWQAVLDSYPGPNSFDVLAAVAFREAGLHEKSGYLLKRALEESPNDIALNIHSARLAEAEGDWKTAVQWWDRAHRLAPDDLNVRNARGDAIWHAGLSNSQIASQSEPREAAPESLRDLALAFEGLGDNCEFGSIQRRAGVEPIGLFRFAAVHPPTLIKLLDNDFDVLGDPEQTYLDPTESGEYLVRDKRGYYQLHSFIRVNAVDADKFLAEQIRRINFLKRKLISDLNAADKIFVYKQSKAAITDAELLGIHQAMQRFGDNTLLGMRLADENNPAGSISVLRNRLYVGYLAHMYVDGGNIQDLDVDSWFNVMHQAYSFRFNQSAREPAQAEAC